MSYLPNFNGLDGFKNNGHTNGYTNGHTNGQSPDHPNGSLAESGTDLTTLWNKFERYQQHDLEKTEWMNVRELYCGLLDLSLMLPVPLCTCRMSDPGERDPQG
jgi:hypothetical protein